MLSLHLLFGLPFPLFLSHGVYSVVFLSHSWFVIRATCPAHLPLASITFSMASFTPVLDLKSLFLILSLLVTPSIDRSMLLWVTASFSLWRLVSDCQFLFSHINANCCASIFLRFTYYGRYPRGRLIYNFVLLICEYFNRITYQY